jgi:hypothetical protein
MAVPVFAHPQTEGVSAAAPGSNRIEASSMPWAPGRAITNPSRGVSSAERVNQVPDVPGLD